jgi:hypothetical protein
MITLMFRVFEKCIVYSCLTKHFYLKKKQHLIQLKR